MSTPAAPTQTAAELELELNRLLRQRTVLSKAREAESTRLDTLRRENERLAKRAASPEAAATEDRERTAKRAQPLPVEPEPAVAAPGDTDQREGRVRRPVTGGNPAPGKPIQPGFWERTKREIKAFGREVKRVAGVVVGAGVGAASAPFREANAAAGEHEEVMAAARAAGVRVRPGETVTMTEEVFVGEAAAANSEATADALRGGAGRQEAIIAGIKAGRGVRDGVQKGNNVIDAEFEPVEPRAAATPEGLSATVSAGPRLSDDDRARLEEVARDIKAIADRLNGLVTELRECETRIAELQERLKKVRFQEAESARPAPERRFGPGEDPAAAHSAVYKALIAGQEVTVLTTAGGVPARSRLSLNSAGLLVNAKGVGEEVSRVLGEAGGTIEISPAAVPVVTAAPVSASAKLQVRTERGEVTIGAQDFNHIKNTDEERFNAEIEATDKELLSAVKAGVEVWVDPYANSDLSRQLGVAGTTHRVLLSSPGPGVSGEQMLVIRGRDGFEPFSARSAACGDVSVRVRPAPAVVAAPASYRPQVSAEGVRTINAADFADVVGTAANPSTAGAMSQRIAALTRDVREAIGRGEEVDIVLMDRTGQEVSRSPVSIDPTTPDRLKQRDGLTVRLGGALGTDVRFEIKSPVAVAAPAAQPAPAATAAVSARPVTVIDAKLFGQLPVQGHGLPLASDVAELGRNVETILKTAAAAGDEVWMVRSDEAGNELKRAQVVMTGSTDPASVDAQLLDMDCKRVDGTLAQQPGFRFEIRPAAAVAVVAPEAPDLLAEPVLPAKTVVDDVPAAVEDEEPEVVAASM